MELAALNMISSTSQFWNGLISRSSLLSTSNKELNLGFYTASGLWAAEPDLSPL